MNRLRGGDQSLISVALALAMPLEVALELPLTLTLALTLALTLTLALSLTLVTVLALAALPAVIVMDVATICVAARRRGRNARTTVVAVAGRHARKACSGESECGYGCRGERLSRLDHKVTTSSLCADTERQEEDLPALLTQRTSTRMSLFANEITSLMYLA